jgi:hypothetical protein
MTAERRPVGGGSCRGRPRAGSSSRCFLFGPLVPTYGYHRTIKCNPTEQDTDPAGTERACQMFTAKQYRAKAAEFKAFLTDIPRSPSEIKEFRDLEQIYTTLAENEEWMTIHLDKTIFSAAKIARTVPPSLTRKSKS